MAAPLSVVTTGGGMSNQRLLKTIAGAGGGDEKDIQKSCCVLRKKGRSFAAVVLLKIKDVSLSLNDHKSIQLLYFSLMFVFQASYYSHKIFVTCEEI